MPSTFEAPETRLFNLLYHHTISGKQCHVSIRSPLLVEIVVLHFNAMCFLCFTSLQQDSHLFMNVSTLQGRSPLLSRLQLQREMETVGGHYDEGQSILLSSRPGPGAWGRDQASTPK